MKKLLVVVPVLILVGWSMLHAQPQMPDPRDLPQQPGAGQGAGADQLPQMPLDLGEGNDAKSAWHLSAPIVKDIREVKAFLGVSAKTSMKDFGDTLGKTFMPMLDKIKSERILVDGAPVFLYHGMTGDSAKPFDLMTGVPVDADTKAPAGYEVGKLPAFRAITVYYTGPMSSLGKGYDKLFALLEKSQYKPTGEHREVYLFLDGEESPNNIIEIQFGIEAGK